MATWDEAVAKLPKDDQPWCETIAEEAGTYDGDFAVFAAAAKLLQDRDAKLTRMTMAFFGYAQNYGGDDHAESVVSNVERLHQRAEKATEHSIPRNSDLDGRFQ